MEPSYGSRTPGAVLSPKCKSYLAEETSVLGGIANSTGMVTLNAPAAGTAALRQVTLSSSNTAATTVPALP